MACVDVCDDVWSLCIFPYARIDEVLALGATCRYLRRLTRADCLWQRLYARDHPLLQPHEAGLAVCVQLNAVLDFLAKPNAQHAGLVDFHRRVSALREFLLELNHYHGTHFRSN